MYLIIIYVRVVTEWVITKTEVGKEMEIFITLIKYNTRLQRGEDNPLLVVTT